MDKQNKKTDNAKNDEHIPVLLGEDNVHDQAKPPYVLIAILVFIILSSFWKIYMVNKNKGKDANAAPPVTQPIDR
ncbi:MAG: hypothetical protein ACRBDI_03190 [Alphaproteobacteria bacterium]